MSQGPEPVLRVNVPKDLVDGRREGEGGAKAEDVHSLVHAVHLPIVSCLTTARYAQRSSGTVAGRGEIFVEPKGRVVLQLRHSLQVGIPPVVVVMMPSKPDLEVAELDCGLGERFQPDNDLNLQGKIREQWGNVLLTRTRAWSSTVLDCQPLYCVMKSETLCYLPDGMTASDGRRVAMITHSEDILSW